MAHTTATRQRSSPSSSRSWPAAGAERGPSAAHSRDRRRRPAVPRGGPRVPSLHDDLPRRLPTPDPTPPVSRACVAGETTLVVHRRRGGPPAVPRVPDRRAGPGRLIRRDRGAAVDWRVAARRDAALPAGAGRRDGRAPRAAPATPSRWTRSGPPSPSGVRPTNLAWPPTPSRPARSPRSPRPRWRRSRGSARAWSPSTPDPELDLVRGFLYQLNGERPTPHGARARRLLHRRRRARLQRVHVHRPRHHRRPAPTSRPRCAARSAR